jgi:AmiR/NasT family two-component response regulator
LGELENDSEIAQAVADSQPDFVIMALDKRVSDGKCAQIETTGNVVL